MTLNVNLLLCHPCYAYFDQMSEAEARVPTLFLHLSYPHIKFDDDI